MHADGYRHRDIKPSNLMVHNQRGRLQVKLVDLGSGSLPGEGDNPMIRICLYLPGMCADLTWP